MRHYPAAARLLAAVLLVAAAALPATAQNAFAPAVVVNEDVITNYDVDQRMRLLVVNGAPADSPQLAQIAVDQLIEDRLKRAAAERRGLALNDAAIDAAFDDYADQRGWSRAELSGRLARGRVAEEALAFALGSDVLWRETVRARFGARAEPTEAEIDQEIALAASGQASAYRIAEIALPFARRGEDETRALGQRLSRELSGAGEAAFAAAARRYSASATAGEGGAIGWVPANALPPAAAATLADLEVGEVSAPVNIPGGVALLRLAETRNEQAPWASETTVDLLALSAPGADAEALARATSEAAAEAVGCDEAAELASALGLRAERRGPTAVSALPEALRGAITGLTAGDATGPIDGPGGPAAYVLCARAGGPSPEAREALRRRIRGERLERFATGLLEELRADAVIERR